MLQNALTEMISLTFVYDRIDGMSWSSNLSSNGTVADSEGERKKEQDGQCNTKLHFFSHARRVPADECLKDGNKERLDSVDSVENENSGIQPVPGVSKWPKSWGRNSRQRDTSVRTADFQST